MGEPVGKLPRPMFDAARFQAELRTDALGRFLLYRPVTETTMTLARREAEEGAPHGTLVLAEEQTAGRGRRGRSFYSPAGENLYFTLVLRCGPAVHRRLPLAVPLAVARACAGEGVDSRIKWPNDVWVGERKLSGILIDAELSGDEALALPGVGINVNGDPTANPKLRDVATSLRLELGHTTSRERLLAHVCNILEASLDLAADELSRRYRAISLVLGRRVVVRPVAGEAFEGVAEAVEDGGSLVVERAGGGREVVTAAEVSVRPKETSTEVTE